MGIEQGGLRRLTSDGLVVLAWQLARLATAYVLLALFYLWLEPAEISVYTNFISLTSIAVPIFLLKPEAMVARSYFADDSEGFAAYTGSVISFCVAGSLAALLVIILFQRPLADLTGLGFALLLLLPLYLFAYGHLYVSSTLLQVHGKLHRFSAMRGIEGVFRLLLGALFVGLLHYHASGAAFAVAGAMILAALMSAALTRSDEIAVPKLARSRIRDYIADGLPTVPMTLGMAAMQSVDRFSLTAAKGASVAGVYGFGAVLASSLWLMANAFQQAWMPWIFKLLTHRHDTMHRQFWLAFLGFVAGMAVATAGLVVMTMLAAKFYLRSSYDDLYVLILPLSLTAFATSVRLPFDSVFYYFRKSWWLSAFICIGLAVATLGCWVTIGSNGAFGVAWSMLGGTVVTLVLSLWMGVRLLRDTSLPEKAPS